MEEGNTPTPTSNGQFPPQTKRKIEWGLLLLNCVLMTAGSIGGPLLTRLYYVHGGARKWVPSWLQTVGFPIILIPLSVSCLQNPAQEPPAKFIAETKLLIASVFIGLLFGVGDFMYSFGLAYLPVSTSSLLVATQLAFTALFARIIVKQKFTFHSVNSVVLMTLGSVLLGVDKTGDRPSHVSSGQYVEGFFITVASAALLGFVLPSIEFAYSKSSRTITYTLVMHFQLSVAIFATILCTVGMLINKDFQAIPREAQEYGLGETKYYVVLVSCAILFQLQFIGLLGIIFCSSSLFSGVFISLMLPLVEAAGVIAFNEKFTAEKGMSLVLCMWGFASYFYGAYAMNKKQKSPVAESELSSTAA